MAQIRLTVSSSLLILCVGAIIPSHARTLYVSESGNDSDGTTWTNAFTTIQGGLIISTTGDVILVSEGLYSGNITITTPITLIGGNIPTQKMDAGSLSGYSSVDGRGAGSVFHVFRNSTIRNFRIFNGRAGGGGGVRIYRCMVALQHCIITNNVVTDTGGGVGCDQGSLSLIDCFIKENEATVSGGGVGCISGQVSISNSLLTGNYCPGLYPDDPFSVDPIPGQGGGLSINGGQALVSNCVFYDNNAEAGADIHYRDDGSLLCTNCTFGSTATPNLARRRFGDTTGPTRLVNSVVWGHETPFLGPEWVATYCNIRGGFPGDGNIASEPLFVDPANGDFRLQPGSPCIDSASTTGPPTDLDDNARPFDVPGVGRDGTGDEFDMGAYEFIPLPTPAPTFLNDRSDINESSKVDAEDLLILLADWKKVTGAATN